MSTNASILLNAWRLFLKHDKPKEFNLILAIPKTDIAKSVEIVFMSEIEHLQSTQTKHVNGESEAEKDETNDTGTSASTISDAKHVSPFWISN